MKTKSLSILLVLAIVLLYAVVPAAAQDNTGLRLSLSRDFGYSSGRGQIQGTFSMRASGPTNLSRVTFYLDDDPLGEATAEPFRLRFVTDNYPLGIHTLYAIGVTSDGRELRSNEIRAEFVSADESWQAAGRILGPILGFVLVAMLLSFATTMLSAKKLKNLPPGTERKYGFAGGAICPRCQRPFALQFFSLNLGLHKLGQCPFCGKIGAMRVRSLSELRAAEAAELKAAQEAGTVPTPSEAEKLAKELDDSRYHDL